MYKKKNFFLLQKLHRYCGIIISVEGERAGAEFSAAKCLSFRGCYQEVFLPPHASLGLLHHLIVTFPKHFI